MQTAIDDLDTTLGDVASPWLIAPLQDRLDELDSEINDAKPKLDNVVTAVQVAPSMLGADGERRYFIAFTTPAETRGLGGFMGTWAELTADNGRLTIADFGTTADLDQGGTTTGTGRTLDGPQEWLDQWGEFGFTTGPNGGTEPEPWSNVTISPEFPSTGDVIAQLFPQSGGDEIDGVFAMDPYVLEALLGLMGPITVEGSATPLDEDNVVDFLLVDQYEIDDTEARTDLLAAVSQATAQQVLGGALPSPTVLADSLSPLAAQGRLAGWARDGDAQALLEAIHLSGAMPDLAGGDGVAVVLNNAGGNRLDVHLDRELDYDTTVDTDTGEVSSTATVTLTNTAPASGLPASVSGDEQGANRTHVSLYSALPIESATVTTSAGGDAGNRRGRAIRVRAGRGGRLAGRIRIGRHTAGRVGHDRVRAGWDTDAPRRLHPRAPAATDRDRRAAVPPRQLHRRRHPDRRIGSGHPAPRAPARSEATRTAARLDW